MSGPGLSQLDTRLLAAVQEQVPLVERPFDAIAQKLRITESLVIERLTALRDGKGAKIRQISAIFDSKSLGYQSTLVAAKVAEEQLPAAVAAINAHPGVSHNYRRDHAWNLWFTLGVGPDSRLGLENTAEILQRRSGALSLRLMPTIKMYKIGLKLPLDESAETGPPPVPAKPARTSPITEQEKRLIRLLQRDLPITPRPFDAWAEEAQMSVAELLSAGRRFCHEGLMRRFSAVLRHRELGFDANAMGVWVVPPEQQDSFGSTAAGFAQVSHCYLRPTYADWPYSIFTMIHARDRDQGSAVLKSISAATGISEYAALYSTQEYKKVRLRYFEPDIAAWEAAAI